MADESKQDTPSGSDTACNQDKEIADAIINEWTSEANNGSEKCQLQLGCHYLRLAESNIDSESNAEKAVIWLVSASKQGNVEATEKLRHCVQTNLGISDINKSEVTWCLKTSTSEKKIRYAARSLFNKINFAHQGVLSKQEYVEAINNLTGEDAKQKKLLLAAGKKIGTAITENDFVKILSKKIHGTLTLTSAEMDETNAAYDSAGLLQKIFVYPRQTASLALDRGLEYASKEGMSLVLSLIPTNQLYLLMLLFVYSYITPGFLFLAIPLMTFAISFLVMVISTLQMFYKRRKQRDATTLATMLKQQFDVDIDLETTESQYSWNSLTPYLVFFISLPIMIMSFSLTNKSYIPCAEVYVVSIVLTVFCLIGLSDSHDFVTLLAVGSHTFASLPVIFANVPKVTVLTKLIELITRPFFSFYLGLGVSFNFSLPSFVFMLIPVLLFRMAMKGSWSGVYKILIPHLVCYFWYSFSTTVFPFTTWSGLARATVGYLLLPVFVPLSIFFLLIGIPYSLYKLLQTDVVGKLLVTLLLLAVPVLLNQTKLLSGKSDKKASLKEQQMRKIIMIVFAVLSVFPLLFVRIPTIVTKRSLTLTWEDYRYLCIPRDDLWAPYQIRCHDFLGTKVQWKGTVVQVKVTKVENTAENIIKALPSIFSEPLYCLYGKTMPKCDETTMSDKSFRHCQLLHTSGQTCQLSSLNQIFLSLSVKIDEYVLNIDAGSSFKSALLSLEPGDEVEFSGTLTEVGVPSPGLKLKSMNWTSRELNAEMKEIDDLSGETMMKTLSNAVVLLFNFGFFPVLEYSPD